MEPAAGSCELSRPATYFPAGWRLSFCESCSRAAEKGDATRSPVRNRGFGHGTRDVLDMNGSATVSDLVGAARGGDRDAWNGLVQRYMPLVAGVAGRYRLGPDDVADVSQALWLRLVEHLDDLREPRALPGWIVTTTKNEALRVLRTRQRTVAVDPQTGTVLDGADRGAPLETDLIRLERQQALRDGLKELRPQHRELLLLLMTDPPLSYDEISRRLGIPKGSIGPTRARALEALRQTEPMRSFLPTSDSVS